MAAAGSSEMADGPRWRLPTLPDASPDAGAGITANEKMALLADAHRCLELMKGRLDVDGVVILDARTTLVTLEQAQPFVAAALALLSGRFRRHGKPVPSNAAAACGKPTKNPSRVTEWQEKLERLDASLAQQRRRQEEAAERARSELVHACVAIAVQNVLRQVRMDRLLAAAEDSAPQKAVDEPPVDVYEEAAEYLGLYARAVRICAPNADAVKRFCSAFLDALAAWRLEYEGDYARSIWDERCTPVRVNALGLPAKWSDEDEQLFVLHVGKGSDEHAAFLAHIKWLRSRCSDVLSDGILELHRPTKYSICGFIFGASEEHPTAPFLHYVRALEAEHLVVCMLETLSSHAISYGDGVSSVEDWWRWRVGIWKQHRGNRLGQVAFHIAWTVRSCVADLIFQLETDVKRAAKETARLDGLPCDACLDATFRDACPAADDWPTHALYEWPTHDEDSAGPFSEPRIMTAGDLLTDLSLPHFRINYLLRLLSACADASLCEPMRVMAASEAADARAEATEADDQRRRSERLVENSEGRQRSAHMDAAVESWRVSSKALKRAQKLQTFAPPVDVLMQSGDLRLLADGRIVRDYQGVDFDVASPPYCTVNTLMNLQLGSKVSLECWKSTRDGLQRSHHFSELEIHVGRSEAWRWLRALQRFAPVLPHPHDLHPVLEHVFGAAPLVGASLIEQLGHDHAYQFESERHRRAYRFGEGLTYAATPWTMTGVKLEYATAKKQRQF